MRQHLGGQAECGEPEENTHHPDEHARPSAIGCHGRPGSQVKSQSTEGHDARDSVAEGQDGSTQNEEDGDEWRQRLDQGLEDQEEDDDREGDPAEGFESV